MILPYRLSVALSLCLSSSLVPSGLAQLAAPLSASQAPKPQPDPVLVKRPASKAANAQPGEGRIRLDVLVTDAADRPVAGSVADLVAKDFTVFDNGHSQAILSVRVSGKGPPQSPPFSNGAANSDPQVSVLLVLDEVNTGLGEMAIQRDSVQKFLRENGGHLKNPTSLFLLTDTGLKEQTGFSQDGTMLASIVHQLKPGMRTFTAAQGADGALGRFQISVRALASLGQNGAKLPGRKLIIWLGPGWPTLGGQELNYSARGHALNFNSIRSISNGLRDARIEVCSAGGGAAFFQQQFLKPVKSEQQANSGSLALQVIAVQSGGRTLDAGNGSHIANLINECIADVGPYYTVTFDPQPVGQVGEYHDLRVQINKPGLKGRTSAGYYEEP
jgi:VWFA-related protein